MKADNETAGWNLENSYRQLPQTFYTGIHPTPGRDPKMIVYNEELGNQLGLQPVFLQSEEGVAMLGGNVIPEGANPLAQAYAGHQFGNFTRLGDGRAILLGEQITPEGERFDIQLKGAGKTPYSRGGDGRAGLGPMLREYIMSEAMHALGIATTRSLAVVTTGEPVIRETVMEGAIVTRIASSHLRIGTFEYGSAWGTREDLEALADYAIWRHDKEVQTNENPYLDLLQNVIKRQAELIAKWQLVGFIHGVMNTDNMTISGETIDYGPCAFMDTYDPATVFSSIDHQGRYAYGNQPYIGGWNLSRFAGTLLPLLHGEEEKARHLAQDALSSYNKLFQKYWITGMRSKLGIFNEEDADEALMEDLLGMMKKYAADYTNTFLALTFSTVKEDSVLHGTKEFTEWHERWLKRLERQQESKKESQQLMQQSNPAVIPRNHLVEEALEAAVEKKDFTIMEQLLKVLSNPYAHSAEQATYRTVPTQKQPYQTYCGT